MTHMLHYLSVFPTFIFLILLILFPIPKSYFYILSCQRVKVMDYSNINWWNCQGGIPQMGDFSGTLQPSYYASAIFCHQFCQSMKLRLYFPFGLYLTGRSAIKTKMFKNIYLIFVYQKIKEQTQIQFFIQQLQICYKQLFQLFDYNSKMNEQQLDELEATRQSFYKLQDNFNYNLLVIKQLEQDNQKLLEQKEILKQKLHKEIDDLFGVVQQLKKENKRLNNLVKTQVQRVRAQVQQETQQIIDMMNEKMIEQRKYDAQKYAKQKREEQNEAKKYQQSLKYYSLQNSKLIETIKLLRMQKQTLQTQLASLASQKQSYANKLLLHDKELQNMRNASEEWQKILKDKLKQLNKQKQKLQQELSQTKMSYKLRLKTIKQQAGKKLQQVQAGKQKQLRLIMQQTKQIKFQFDLMSQQLQKCKVDAKVQQKQKVRLQKQVQQLSKQSSCQKDMQYLKKMFQQERNQLKNQIAIIENQKNEFKEQLRDSNEKKQEVQKSLQRLKTGLISAQKQISESQRKNKKLQKQIRQLKNQAKRHPELTQLNGGVLPKFQNEDAINQVPNPNHINMEYSKYFSQDMGPGDQIFFMENSIPKSPKNIARPIGQTSTVNHQLMKKIGQQQVEIQQYKNMIKNMSDEIQKAKSNLLDQLNLKQQQIKLGRDQVQLLRQKINDREQQILNLNSQKFQMEDKLKDIEQNTKKIKQLQSQISKKNQKIKNLQQNYVQLNEMIEQLKQKISGNQQQMRILDNINQELRAEVHKYKNRIKLYNQSEQQQFQNQDQEQEYQQMNIPELSIENNSSSNYATKKRVTQQRKPHNSKTKFHQDSKSGFQVNESKTSMKLKDLVLQKRKLQMQGKKIKIEPKYPDSTKSIQKIGTQSQKQIFEHLKKKSKSKQKKKQRNEKQRIERLRGIDYDRLLGRNQNQQENQKN